MKRFILTVGPSLLNRVPLTSIHGDNHIYRINGAHGAPEDIENTIVRIREQIPSADILVDLPGNKVRIVGNYELVAGENIVIPSENFNFKEFYKFLKKGMAIFANDSIFKLEVVSADAKNIIFLSKSTGTLANGKGMHCRGLHEGLPFLFDKDKALIDIANRRKITYVGLSFVRNTDDIDEAESLIENCEIIVKIETLAAVRNINKILAKADYFLIDRGDLSSDVGIENIPRYQNFIIDKVNFFQKHVFIATQLLKNMETKPIPTIAEIEAYYALLKKGVYGFQLSEETAIGEHVKECVEILGRLDKNVYNEGIDIGSLSIRLVA